MLSELEKMKEYKRLIFEPNIEEELKICKCETKCKKGSCKKKFNPYIFFQKKENDQILKDFMEKKGSKIKEFLEKL